MARNYISVACNGEWLVDFNVGSVPVIAFVMSDDEILHAWALDTDGLPKLFSLDGRSEATALCQIETS